MRRVQSKCREIAPPTGLGLPISFPFGALGCLFQNGSDPAHFKSPLTPVFLKACGPTLSLPNSTFATELSLWLFYPLGSNQEAKIRPIPLHLIALLPTGGSIIACHQLPCFLTFRTAIARHSKRRISTGNRRDAARAGSNVAPTDIAIATTVIQTPSQTLGWNGTNGTE